MADRIFVIGASVSGVTTLCALVSRLPATLPAAILVVQHTTPDGPGLLHEILGRAGPLPACRAQDMRPIEEALLARRVATDRADADGLLSALLHERAHRLRKRAAQIAAWLAAGDSGAD